MDTALNKNQTELGVLILTIALQMLTDLDGLLDEHVQILGDLRGQTGGLEDTDNLLASDLVYLGDTVGVTKDDTDLGGGKTLLGKLADVLLDIGGGELAPAGWCALVRAGTLRDTLSWCVHASHAVVGRKEKQLQSVYMSNFTIPRVILHLLQLGTVKRQWMIAGSNMAKG